MPSRRQTEAIESRNMATLLVYPLVRRISRFSFPRHTECSPSFQFTAPPLPTLGAPAPGWYVADKGFESREWHNSLPHLEQPEQFLQELLEFLEE